MSSSIELSKEHRGQTIKFVYYVIALCIASIAFTVQQTSGSPLKYTQIPLAFSLVLWFVSVVFGFLYLRAHISMLYWNNIGTFIGEGYDPKLSSNESRRFGVDHAEKEIKKIDNRSSYHQSIQLYSFYIGVACFVVWHIIEMYIKTIEVTCCNVY